MDIPWYKIGNVLYKNSFLGNLTGTISLLKGRNSPYSSISALEDWDFVTPVEIPQYKIGNFLYKNSFLGNLTGTISLIKGHNSLYCLFQLLKTGTL